MSRNNQKKIQTFLKIADIMSVSYQKRRQNILKNYKYFVSW